MKLHGTAEFREKSRSLSLGQVPWIPAQHPLEFLFREPTAELTS
jgi:hypothetical protein